LFTHIYNFDYNDDACLGSLFIKHAEGFHREKELRALAYRTNDGRGVNIPVASKVLIESLALSPDLPDWAAPFITELIDPRLAWRFSVDSTYTYNNEGKVTAMTYPTTTPSYNQGVYFARSASEIRIDYVQHALSAWLRYEQLYRPSKPLN
jgi:hypothetical protein